MNETDKTTVNLLTHEAHARAEHGELHQLLDEIRNQFCACSRETGAEKGRCLTEAARRLQQHIEAHFAHEECGGWLEEAVVRAPHLAHRLTMLEREHAPLRKQAAELVKVAETLDRTNFAAEELHDEFEKFAAKLLEHEANEVRVLAEGFNEELDLD